MATDDKCCTIAPYFRVHEGQLDAFRQLCGRFVAATHKEPKCLYYGFCFDRNVAHCREGYEDAEALLLHAQRIRPLIEEALTISELMRLEVHGPEQELNLLREPLAGLKPQFFVLEYGFRR
ncbi:MAG: antibiotic biosynthesis monooxygenase [Pirellulales bacterium]|nr:antibiotic biosynthesis monooxygenase [Pirellulales bacterium]